MKPIRRSEDRAKNQDAVKLSFEIFLLLRLLETKTKVKLTLNLSGFFFLDALSL